MIKTKCFVDALPTISASDLQAIEQGVAERIAAGTVQLASIRQAELGAVADLLADIAQEHAEILSLARAQHPTAFAPKSPAAAGQQDIFGAANQEPIKNQVVDSTQDSGAQADKVALASSNGAPANTEDSGAELTYNRRNRIKSGIKWDDIASKNDALKVKEAVKQNIYPRPDYQALVDGGMQPIVAHLVKQVYDAIAAKPNTRAAPTDSDLQAYIAGIDRVMTAVIGWANDPAAVSKWAKSQARGAAAMLGKATSLSDLAESGASILDRVYPNGWKDNRAEVVVLGGNKFYGALQPGYEGSSRAVKAVSGGWPAKQESWQKRGLKVVHAEKVEVYYYEGKRTKTEAAYVSINFKTGKHTYAQTTVDAESKDAPEVKALLDAEIEATQGKWLLLDKRGALKSRHDSEEAAKDAAREMVKPGGRASGPDDSGIDVSIAAREGVARRMEGEDINSDRLRDEFGFKGVNFGTWMKGDSPALVAERQAHLNHAFDSMADLADLFSVPPKAMSLNGMLGLAIGAQGRGGINAFAAHFVPGVNEINLTRAAGAGSLAHEFGHALDHYFATQAGFDRRQEPFLTEHAGSAPRSAEISTLRPEIQEAFKAIVAAMNKRPQTAEEAQTAHDAGLQRAKTSVDGWLKSWRKDFVAAKVDADAFDALAQRIRALDLGDGQTMVSRSLAVYQRIDELRQLYKTATGRVYSIDQIKGLQANVHHLEYMSKPREHLPQQMVRTDYAKAAAGLDADKKGKAYWSTNLEKFARAFDAFVSDALEARAAKNTYLSHAGRTGETVPMGKEREAINAQIQTLLGEIKTRDGEDETGDVAMFSRASSPTWYSALVRSVDALNMKAGPAQGWKDAIKGLIAKGSIKADEVEAVGLIEFLDLQEGKVTKETVQGFVKANGVQVTETVLGSGGLTTKEVVELRELDDLLRRELEGQEGVMDAADHRRMNELVARKAPGDTPKYGEYQLPGGTNYREVLLTLPDQHDAEATAQTERTAAYTAFDRGEIDHVERNQRVAAASAASAAKAYRSGHWPNTPNVLAHIRINDRVDADGRKIMFVEEIQSDLGQTTKKKGAAGTIAAALKANGMTEAEFKSMPAADQEFAINETRSMGLPPRMPFADATDKWLALALKRVIKLAVDEGYEKIAFISGEQSAARYDLSKQIKSINVTKLPGGLYSVKADGLNGSRVIDEAYPADKLADVIGKEMAEKAVAAADKAQAEKGIDTLPDGYDITMDRTTDPARQFTITPSTQGHGRPFAGRHATQGEAVSAAVEKINQERDRSVTFEGLDLKVGGSGMTAFYNKIVPAVTKDVLRKLGGGAMETVSVVIDKDGWKISPPSETVSGRWMVKSSDYNSKGLQFDTEAEARAALAEKQGSKDQPGFNITDSMKERVAGGVPLFAREDSQGAIPLTDTPSTNPADIKAAQALNNALVSYGLGAQWSDAYEAVTLPDALSGIREAIQTAFGRDVRPVAPTAAGFNIFNGVYIPSQPNTVYVNVQSEVGFVQVAGHELWHSIKRDRPELAAWYRKQAELYYKNIPAYQDKLNKLLQPGEKPYGLDKALEELDADFLGDSLADPAFLQQLAEASPSKFTALLSRVRMWLAGLARKIKGLGSEQYISDVKALQSYLKDVLVAHAEGKSIEQVRGVPLFSRAHAAHHPLPDWVASGSADLKAAAAKIDTYAPRKPLKDKLRELSAGWSDKLVQGMFDAYAPLKTLSMDAYIAARMTKTADGAFEGMLLHGMPVMTDDGGLRGALDGKGFLGAMSELAGEHDRFFMWLAGNRAARLIGEGKENLFTPAEIAAMQSQNNGTMADGSSRVAAYKRAHATFNAYSKSVLDIAEKAGLIDGEARKMWEHDFYVPFYRVNDDAEMSGPAHKVKGLVRQKAFERLKGGVDPLGDLLDNTLRNWSHLLSSSLANVAAAKALQAAERVGVAIEATEDMAKEMAKVAGKQGHAVYFMDHGVQRWFVVDSPAVLTAISALEAPTIGGVPLKVMSKFKRFLTVGVTIAPAFKIRNLLRDTVAAPAMNKMSYNVAKNLARGWGGTKRGSDHYAQMLFGGAMMRFGTYLEGDRAAHVKRLIDAGVSPDTILDSPNKIKAAAIKAWDVWQDFGDRLENVNRSALYDQLVKGGMSQREAAFHARDMMDFGLQGSWAAMRMLTAVVPFLNARAQGLYKLGRGMKEDPLRVGYVVGAVALASITLMLAYEDDDDWKAREDWDRDMFWWFKVGDTAYRIPKPFEVGALGTIAERSLELMINDEMTGKRFAERMRTMVFDTFAANPVPQMFKPMMDLYANKDSFTGRQIETLGMERFSKPERHRSSTSGVAKLLGSAGEYTNVSPVQVDHMIRSYFGWLGAQSVAAVDMITRAAGDTTAPALRGDEFLGGFVKELPTPQSRYLEDFYKQAKVSYEAMADLKRARETGEVEKASEIMAERGQALGRARMYQRAERQMTDINRRIRYVRDTPNIDADTKREQLDTLTASRNRLAKVVAERVRAPH